MKQMKTVLMGCMLLVSLAGCGEKSKLEGTVVDGKAQPLAGVRVVAKNVKSGSEQYEATTAADGKFQFAKIDAASEYELIPYLGNKAKGRSFTFKTAPKGQTMILPQVLPVLFAPTKDGLLVRNTISGVLWVRDASKCGAMDWNAAMALPKNFNYAGFSDWRLPTKDELRALTAFAKGKPGGAKPFETLNDELFTNVRPDYYWTDNDKGENKLFAWAINMATGEVSDDQKTMKHQVILVRSEK